MPIDYETLMQLEVRDAPCSYTDRDSILYALGVGFGADPIDRNELAYVYEQPSLKTVPTWLLLTTVCNIIALSGIMTFVLSTARAASATVICYRQDRFAIRSRVSKKWTRFC